MSEVDREIQRAVLRKNHELALRIRQKELSIATGSKKSDKSAEEITQDILDGQYDPNNIYRKQKQYEQEKALDSIEDELSDDFKGMMNKLDDISLAFAANTNHKPSVMSGSRSERALDSMQRYGERLL